MTSRVCVVTLVSLFLCSCTASQHAVVITLNQPAATETDEAKWFAYYEDQFDANGGEVELPGPDAPGPARQGYERAKVEWERRDDNAKWGTFLIAVPIGIAIGLLIGPSLK